MTISRLAAGLCLCLGLGACGDQASTEYEGEPLFTMNGRIAQNLSQPSASELQPALAFIGLDSELRFLDVQMRGELLSDFTLDVFERPPEAAFFPVYLVDSPRVALARFTLLPAGHPDTLWIESSSGGAGCLGAGCEPADSTSYEMTSWCTTHGERAEHCFVETLTCPASDASAEDCEVTTYGDPALHVEVVSVNYLLMYIDAPAAPGSVASYLASAKETGLPAGYHLLAVERQTQVDAAQGELCEDQAEELALERYNEQFGTDFALDDIELADKQALEHLNVQAVADLDCHAMDEVWRHVPDPAAERVQIRIGDPASHTGFL